MKNIDPKKLFLDYIGHKETKLKAGDEAIYLIEERFLRATQDGKKIIFPTETYVTTSSRQLESESEFRNLMASWAKTMGFRKRITRETGRLVCKFCKKRR